VIADAKIIVRATRGISQTRESGRHADLRQLACPFDVLYYSAGMSQPAGALDYAKLSDELEHLSAELPGAGARVLSFASREQLAARTAKAQEDAFADACADVWRQVADRPEDVRQRVRASLDKIMEIVEDLSDAYAAAAWEAAHPNYAD
jgi:hypothetical protein